MAIVECAGRLLSGTQTALSYETRLRHRQMPKS